MTGPAAKALTCIMLTAAGAVAAGLIVGTAAAWVAVVTAALTTAGVWRVPNTPDAGEGGYTDRRGLLYVLAIIVAVLLILWLLGVPVTLGAR